MPIIKSVLDKILLLTTIIVVTVASVLLFISIREETKSLESALLRENLKLAEMASKSIEAGYPARILPLEILKVIEESENVLFWRLVKPNGEIYLANDAEFFGKVIDESSLGTKVPLVQDSVFHKTKEKIKLIAYPVRTEDIHKPWTFYLAFSEKTIAEARYILISKSIGFLSLIIFFVSIISFYLSKTITKPLEELRKAAFRIGKGEFVKAKIMSKDEIGELAKVFNKTTEDLRKTHLSLKEAQRKAEEEKNKTLAIIANFSDGLLIFDDKHNLVLVNPRAEHFLKIKSEEVAGRSASELSKFPTIKLLTDILGEKTQEIFREELQLQENLILEVSEIPIVRKEKVMEILVILHDITREKTVARLKTEFISLTAHQLRTPLSAIKWSLRMILDGDVGEITKEQRNLLTKTCQSNERMVKLINDLLNVTKIEEGRYLFELSSAHLEDVVQFVIDSHKMVLKKQKIKFIFRKPKRQLPELKLDVEKMRLVVQNLLDNAITYTPKNGKVIIELKKVKNQIKFSIKDTGVGIPKTQQKRIFSKFFRARNAVKIATEGSGLGLFLAKNIIESHKGKIWFESEEGNGSIFHFTLPCS